MYAGGQEQADHPVHGGMKGVPYFLCLFHALVSVALYR
jgi:hypothetical protein